MINKFLACCRANALGIIRFVFLFYACCIGIAYASPPSGVAPLVQGSGEHVVSSIDPTTRSLLTSQQQIAFLSELEGTAPDWKQLHNRPGEEHGERLFAFNRKRDEIRESHPLLKHRVAFSWTGILRRFIPEQQGFSVAMGPELTVTDWGIIRFKPMDLPDEMVAIPAPPLLRVLQRQLAAKKEVHIGIIFTGHLVPYESIMYAFSHDDSEQGMIMPVVQVEEVGYVLELQTNKR